MEHVAALASDLTRLGDIEIRASTSVLDAGLERMFSAHGDSRVSWGITGVTTRVALLDLFSHSDTSLSWRMFCHPEFGSVGSVVRAPLMYDRCAACPRIVSPPPGATMP